METAELRLDAWSLENGIEVLEIHNGVGRVTVLPFVGQQIWDAHFHGRPLTMRHSFDHPVATTEYLHNNGAYLIHCGGSAMGNPGPHDRHPLHGELPNARLDSASLRWSPSTDTAGETVTIVSTLTHRVAFGPWFSAQLELTIAAGSGLMDSVVRLTNLSGDPAPLMYLAHLNFRPAIGGHLDEELSPGQSITTRDGTGTPRAPTSALLAPGRRVTPELVQTVPLRTGVDGWRTSRQVHPDASSDVVEHYVGDLTHTIRWMRRSPDDDAFAFAIPATAEPDGYSRAEQKGDVVHYQHRDGLVARFRHGALAPEEPLPPTR
ncbi:DUF4432 family protein [Ruania zhangjianzhongii]|uniref:DUF4432 family protein n=1 Tax=Ruania zhangjianzhongii TaxID=2603206 RepID=UPI00143D2A5C|nr:DUF4432 family protein [Ruania zhangjianzhongii]